VECYTDFEKLSAELHKNSVMYGQGLLRLVDCRLCSSTRGVETKQKEELEKHQPMNTAFLGAKGV
jgi:hypothetical protein